MPEKSCIQEVPLKSAAVFISTEKSVGATKTEVGVPIRKTGVVVAIFTLLNESWLVDGFSKLYKTGISGVFGTKVQVIAEFCVKVIFPVVLDEPVAGILPVPPVHPVATYPVWVPAVTVVVALQERLLTPLA